MMGFSAYRGHSCDLGKAAVLIELEQGGTPAQRLGPGLTGIPGQVGEPGKVALKLR